MALAMLCDIHNGGNEKEMVVQHCSIEAMMGYELWYYIWSCGCFDAYGDSHLLF